MNRVALVAAGQSPFGELIDQGIKELFAQAVGELLQRLHARRFDDLPFPIEAFFLGHLGVGGFQLGQTAPLLASYMGLGGKRAVRVENACASGGYALLAGVEAIASGTHAAVLVGGVEKMRDLTSLQARRWLGVSGDTEYERLAGLTFAGVYALMAQRYLHEYGWPHRVLSAVAVKNHAHGTRNSKAHFRRAITLEQAEQAPLVASPLRLFDCSPTSDGAAAVLLTTVERAHELGRPWVEIVGWGAASDYVALHDRERITGLRASREAARQAYAMAGLGPAELHVAEVHDCFTIAELMAYEDLGLAPEGQGPRLVEEGVTRLGGRLPVNVSGGLKAKGHPLGATGVAQAIEMYLQLTGQGGERQVMGAEVGLTHNVGGSGGSAVVMLYRSAGS